MDWYEIKSLIEETSGIGMDALHVILGVLLQILAALLTRRPLGNWVPWAVVFLIQLANEALDLRDDTWPDRTLQYFEGGKDIVLTMVLPTVLLIACRLAPGLFAAHRAGRDAAPPL